MKDCNTVVETELRLYCGIATKINYIAKSLVAKRH